MGSDAERSLSQLSDVAQLAIQRMAKPPFALLTSLTRPQTKQYNLAFVIALGSIASARHCLITVADLCSTAYAEAALSE